MSLRGHDTLLVAAGALLVLVGAGCRASSDPTKAPPAKFQLEGSVTQLFDLGYDAVRVQASADDVSVLFIRTRPLSVELPDGGIAQSEETGMSEDYPIKITYALWGDEVPVKLRVDLAEVSDNEAKTPRAVISRDVLNDPRKTYPKVLIGTLILNQTPEPGARVTGDFNITFEQGSETASGRTVFGSFDARVPQ